MLELENVSAYHGAVQAVRHASFTVPGGRVTALVGPNGAGKSTLAFAIAGLNRAREGTVRINGHDLSRASAVEISRAGIGLVPQGRRLFPSLTVAEHFALARRHRRPGATEPAQLLALFPHLERRFKVRAKALSGGEQQMLAIGRAVLAGPEVLVLDEPTEGLAPAIVELVAGLIRHLREAGTGILLFEQEGADPLHVADEVIGISRGVVGNPDSRSTSEEEE